MPPSMIKFKQYMILSFPDFNVKFCIGTDASDSRIGAALFQIKERVTHYLYFAARLFFLKEISTLLNGIFLVP